MAQQDDIPRLNHLVPKWFKHFWEHVREWLRANRPVQGDGILITDAPGGGKLFSVPPQLGLGIRPIVPFGLVLQAGFIIRVYRGSVTTAFGTFTAEGFSAGDTPPYTLDLSETATGVIYIAMTCDDTTGEILSTDNPNSSDALPDNTDTDFHLQLGTFTRAGDGSLAVPSDDVGSQNFELCGGVDPIWGRV